MVVFAAVMGFVMSICLPWLTALLMSCSFFGMAIVCFFGCWYRIDGDTLTVYNMFYPHRLPIRKIRDVRYCRGYLAGAAMSSDRLSIKFIDRSVLKSSMPIEISPKDRDGFVAHLLKINPDISIIHN